MHVLFVHKNFPAQFGHIAQYLTRNRRYRCSFVSEHPSERVGGAQKIQYRPVGGATEKTHYFARTFENAVAHAHGVYDALKPLRATLKPDLIVGHSGFGSTLFLPELFPNTSIINYFEYFYHAHNSDMDFRQDFPTLEQDVLRSRARNAMILLDLEYCAAGYSPTEFQKSLLPHVYQPKVRVIHDGISTEYWKREESPARAVGDRAFDPETRIVTYVSRGFESMRGFDIFMRAAKKIYQQYPNVVFLVVGADRVAYGGDLKYIPEQSFKEYVLNQDEYDLDRILFLGNVPPRELVHIFSLSDLHIYLTVPFVLSWSLLGAMACGCTILASDTAPVREVIQHERNGLLCDFFDVDGFAAQALRVLQEPAAFRELGQAAEETIRQKYSLDVTMPQMVSFYHQVAATT